VHDGGLRERKKSETRRAIGVAALELAVARGPAAVTVDDIAAAAGVSPRTVFNYFGTKEAAILGFDPDRRAALLERLLARPASEPPLTALREALRDGDTDDSGPAIAWRTRARLAREHPQLQAAYIASHTVLEDELTAALAARLDRDVSDPYCRLVATSALNAMRVAVDHVLASGSTDHAAYVAAIDGAFAALASGLSEPATPR
jgi:AcrR family transcriptional regulator